VALDVCFVNQDLECGIWDRQGSCLVPIAELEKLPLFHRETIPLDYMDAIGHMNIRWYMALFDRAARNDEIPIGVVLVISTSSRRRASSFLCTEISGFLPPQE